MTGKKDAQEDSLPRKSGLRSDGSQTGAIKSGLRSDGSQTGFFQSENFDLETRKSGATIISIGDQVRRQSDRRNGIGGIRSDDSQTSFSIWKPARAAHRALESGIRSDGSQTGF